MVKDGKEEHGLQMTNLKYTTRLSHKSVKTYVTMPIGIMGRKSLALID